MATACSSADVGDPAALEFPVSGSEGIAGQLRLPHRLRSRLRGGEMMIPTLILEGECVSLINSLSGFFQLYIEAGLLLHRMHSTHHRCIGVTFSWGRK